MTCFGVVGRGLEKKIALASAGLPLAMAIHDVATKERNAHVATRLRPVVLTLAAGAYIASAFLAG